MSEPTSVPKRHRDPAESEGAEMLWTGIGMTVVAGIALLAVIFAKRTPEVDKLGSVSAHWIAEHHLDSR